MIEFGDEYNKMLHEAEKWSKADKSDIDFFKNLVDVFFSGGPGITRAKAFAIARIFEKKNIRKLAV